ncbi:hypothetical protein GCM10023185_33610 [Hymenobacter saemangeumensis]|uniref:Resolvase/invertase-type recombinase catalytic domain-containing protein n=1 Tax=Hymenobacter saemangeumensis TaxID=1084522 RepID=A0ABP8IPD7_9BACT
MFNLFASLAEFERDIIRERTKAGLTAARARGCQGGRPRGLSKEALSKAWAAKPITCSKTKPWLKSAGCSASDAPPFTATLPTWAYRLVAV